MEKSSIYFCLRVFCPTRGTFSRSTRFFINILRLEKNIKAILCQESHDILKIGVIRNKRVIYVRDFSAKCRNSCEFAVARLTEIFSQKLVRTHSPKSLHEHDDHISKCERHRKKIVISFYNVGLYAKKISGRNILSCK